MKKFSSAVILFFIISSISTNAQSQSTYDFLRLDTSPRAAALAGSFVANSDDPNVIFYNPAGISKLEGSPISFSFLKHIVDINSASLSYSKEIEYLGRFGAGVQYINYGDFTEADEYGNKLGEFSASEMAFLLGYSNKLDENFFYGANVKFIYSSIADASSTGIAVDLGLQYHFPESGWYFGFSALNLGTQLTSYFDVDEDLPTDVQFGLRKELARVPLKFYFAFKKLNEKEDDFGDRFKHFTFGGELRLSKAVNVRLGFDNQKRKDLKIGTSAGIAGISLGLGILISDYKFDYAFSSLGNIGSLHRIGISTDL
ncbi:MAG: type IX secretion system protein PorQ [Ignavibacteria bacterium]|jgi:hypothetical protein